VQTRSVRVNPTAKPNLPIGYWLKRVDNLLTEQIDRVQAVNGITRSEWQFLNLLSEEGLLESMRAFVDAHRLDAIIVALIECGWVMQTAVPEPDSLRSGSG